MKRQGYLFEKIIELDNLALGAYKAFRGKKNKHQVLVFCENFGDNLNHLRDDMIQGRVNFNGYKQFTIYEPKERIICAPTIENSIVQQSVMNVCHPYFDMRLTDSCYASRRGKGQYACLDKVRYNIARYDYFAKLDVRNFFATVDHLVLKHKLERLFKDDMLLNLFDRLIDSYDTERGKGVPIGNLTSQYFANLYLDELDRFAKDKSRVPIYVRYMDDMLLLSNDKIQLKEISRNIGLVAFDNLKLVIKPPLIGRTNNGFNFLGYRLVRHNVYLTSKSRRRYKDKLATIDKDYSAGLLSEKEVSDKMNSVISFVRYADSRKFQKYIKGRHYQG